jgi:hypothetical protein
MHYEVSFTLYIINKYLTTSQVSSEETLHMIDVSDVLGLHPPQNKLSFRKTVFRYQFTLPALICINFLF